MPSARRVEGSEKGGRQWARRVFLELDNGFRLRQPCLELLVFRSHTQDKPENQSKAGLFHDSILIFKQSRGKSLRTAVAAGCDTKQVVHEFQFTKSWIIAVRSRRFGMGAELCGGALLGDEFSA